MSERIQYGFDTHSYEGTYSARISNRTYYGSGTTSPGPSEGLAGDVAYDLVVDFPDGPVIYTDQLPAHRRPADNALIRYADIGDEAIAVVRANSVGFIIFEGLATTQCSQ